MTQGPVAEALLERGFRGYGINLKQFDRFRHRFTVAGAKDDQRDAYLLADSLRTDRHAFRRLSNDEPVIVKLREWSRTADDLQQERTRLASRMREQPWRYHPQMLELADDLRDRAVHLADDNHWLMIRLQSQRRHSAHHRGGGRLHGQLAAGARGVELTVPLVPEQAQLCTDAESRHTRRSGKMHFRAT